MTKAETPKSLVRLAWLSQNPADIIFIPCRENTIPKDATLDRITPNGKPRKAFGCRNTSLKSNASVVADLINLKNTIFTKSHSKSLIHTCAATNAPNGLIVPSFVIKNADVALQNVLLGCITKTRKNAS